MKKRLLRILKYLLLIIVLSTALIAFFANTIATYYIKKAIETTQENNANTPYTFEIEDFSVNVWDGNLDMHGLTLNMKKEAIDSVKNENLASPSLTSLYVKQISVDGLSVTDLLWGKEMVMSSITVDSAATSLLYGINTREVPVKTLESLEIGLTSFQLESFNLNNTHVLVSDIATGDSIIAISGVGFEAGMLKINFEDNTNNLLEASNSFKINAKSIFYGIPDEYSLLTGAIDFDMASTQLSISDLSLERTKHYKKTEGIDNSYATLSIPHLSVNSINKFRLIQSGVFEVAKLTLSDVDFTYHLDAQYEKPDEHIAIMPVDFLFQLKLKFDIAFMEGSNCYFAMAYEYGDNTPSTIISFEKTDFTLNNLTNVPEEEDVFTCDAHTALMGHSAFKTRLSIPLLNREKFHLKGALTSPLPLKNFNPILAHNDDFVFAKESQFDRAEFDFIGNRNTTQGYLKLDYENVKIEKLKVVDNGVKKTKSDLFNILANSLVNNRNLEEQRTYKVGYISYEVPSNQGFAGIIWQSIARGIKDVLLASTPNSEKEIKAIKEKLSSINY